jgi:hypothetical protein
MSGLALSKIKWGGWSQIASGWVLKVGEGGQPMLQGVGGSWLLQVKISRLVGGCTFKFLTDGREVG